MRFTLPAALFALSAAPALAAPPQIVTDLPVTGALAQEVLGELGEVRVLMDAGADPHHYQLRPSDARALQSAGLLIWLGPEMTPWLERAAGNLNSESSLPLLHVVGTDLRSYGAEAEGHNHDHGHDHDDDKAHDHDHDGTDPHAWLSPANAQKWLTAIAESLAAQDPENAAIYAANAQTAVDRITALDTQIAAQLAPVKDKPFVVFHDAYGYFTEYYGLPPAIAISLGDASSPSAARLAEIRGEISESGAVCAFPEYGHDPALIATATEGSTLRLGSPLDPEGRGLSAGATLYDDLLRGIGDTLTDCLSKDG